MDEPPRCFVIIGSLKEIEYGFGYIIIRSRYTNPIFDLIKREYSK